MDKNIIVITDYVIKKLKESGFKIQRYDAFSTNSVYLKLDYGVCNSIRISDHKGKKHLQYRYNLLKNYDGVKYDKSPQGWARNYYGFDSVKKMIKDIILDRDWKIQSYGRNQYQKFMESNYSKNQNEPGFWSKSSEI